MPLKPRTLSRSGPESGRYGVSARWALAAFVLGASLSGADALADDDEITLEREHGWPAGTIQEQLNRDTTLIPYGKGALFVPAMTNPLDEPPVAVWKDGERVGEGTTGQRIIMEPGTYEVRIGSGARQQRIAIQSTIRERFTTVIPVSWAGLAIHVVDERFSSLRGSYEIIRVDDREYMGIGFGTDEQAGEPVTTWVLRPGLYKIVRVGETYRARRDFATVRLVEGHLTHFLLVLNEQTGEFQGGGEVPQEDLFQAKDGFYGSLILGGDVSLNQRDNVPGLPQGISFAFRAFVDARASIEILDNPLVLQLQVEEGQTKPPELPLQKTNDRLDLDMLYVYDLTQAIGPYVRFGGETNLLPTTQNFDEPRAVEFRDTDDVTFLRCQDDAMSVDLGGPVGLSTLREGAGLNMRLLKALYAETTLRAGIGARHTLARGDVFLLRDDLSGENYAAPVPASPCDPNLDADRRVYAKLPSVNRFGVEATLLGVARISRWVLINLELDGLIPFNGFDKTVVEIESSVALKLTTFLSVNYVVRFLLDRFISDDYQLQQDVLLRFSLELF